MSTLKFAFECFLRGLLILLGFALVVAILVGASHLISIHCSTKTKQILGITFLVVTMGVPITTLIGLMATSFQDDKK